MFDRAMTDALSLDPQQSGVLIESYRRAIQATGKPCESAAWTMYAAMRAGVNPNLRNVKEFRQKTSHIGKAIFEKLVPQITSEDITILKALTVGRTIVSLSSIKIV